MENMLSALSYIVMTTAALTIAGGFCLLMICLHEDIFGVEYKNDLEDQDISNKEEGKK